jgi:hypothetical protein
MTIIANIFVLVLVAAMPVGVGLAIWADNPGWLWLSLAAFIVVYAG